jgi:hypothetical protein
MPRDFFPRRDGLALNWSRNFRDRLVADPAGYEFAAEQAAQYAALHDDFAAKLQIASQPSTATRPATIAKNEARRDLEKLLRSMANRIRANAAILFSLKLAIGVRERKRKQTRTPRPRIAPGIRIIDVVAHTVTIQLTDEPGGRFGKPAGVTSAIVFYSVDANPSAPGTKWSVAARSSRARVRINIPSRVPAGQLVWFTALWHNRRFESSPYAKPVATHLSYVPTIRLGLRAAA